MVREMMGEMTEDFQMDTAGEDSCEWTANQPPRT